MRKNKKDDYYSLAIDIRFLWISCTLCIMVPRLMFQINSQSFSDYTIVRYYTFNLITEVLKVNFNHSNKN